MITQSFLTTVFDCRPSNVPTSPQRLYAELSDTKKYLFLFLIRRLHRVNNNMHMH